jgi:hypothetical protein
MHVISIQLDTMGTEIEAEDHIRTKDLDLLQSELLTKKTAINKVRLCCLPSLRCLFLILACLFGSPEA